MNKRLLKFYCMVLLVMLGVTVFQFFSSADRPDNVNGLSRMQAARIAGDSDDVSQHTSGFHLTAGICALLLVGYLFWFMIRKFLRDSQAELVAKENSLYNISLETGRTEYELFHKSAEDWSVSGEKIDQDFRRYMTDQIMPHYAKDFIRKNRTHIDESLIIKREVKPATWTDWAKALLVFPGSVVILVSMVVYFG